MRTEETFYHVRYASALISHDGPLHADSHWPGHFAKSLKQRMSDICVAACEEHHPVVQRHAAYQREPPHLLSPVCRPWAVLKLKHKLNYS